MSNNGDDRENGRTLTLMNRSIFVTADHTDRELLPRPFGRQEVSARGVQVSVRSFDEGPLMRASSIQPGTDREQMGTQMLAIGQSLGLQPMPSGRGRAEDHALNSPEALLVLKNLRELMFFSLVMAGMCLFVLFIQFQYSFTVPLGLLFLYQSILVVFKVRHLRTVTLPAARQMIWSEIAEIACLLLVQAGFILVQILSFPFIRTLLLIPYCIYFFCRCINGRKRESESTDPARRRDEEDEDNSVAFLGNCLRGWLVSQTAFVLLKFDGLFGWDWKVVLFPTWILLIVMVFYSIGVIVIMICIMCYLFEGDNDRSQLRGLGFMFLLFTALSGFTYLFCFGIIELTSHAETIYLKVSFLFLAGTSTLFLATTYLLHRSLLIFIYKLMTDDPGEGMQQIGPSTGIGSMFRRKKRKVEKTESASLPVFLEKMSATYFRQVRDETELKALTTDKQPKKGNPEDKKTQKPAAAVGPKKFVFPPRPSTSKHSTEKKIEFQTPFTPKFVVERGEGADLSEEAKNVILVNSPKNVPMEEQPSGVMCCVCFDKEPDSVFLDCGHGGLCFSCARDIWKNANECYLCRKPISQILQLDLAALHGKVVKVKAVTRLVDESSIQEDANSPVPSIERLP
eukprot:TRINITY_DN8075_c0_g1_i1.p1 TRINITY_DN8075_c0_g1~~TRINITY_DN8075_c0_g1_i1.p1  ORF type:complete len:625 (-),score=103.90 TRINITY_DN8075_c0_g1_i1:72-1946(-)